MSRTANDPVGNGFTLLEVLAAFLIFAVLFTVLAGTASEAFRSEGANRRRLEASLIADEKLAQLEASIPEIDEEEEEQDIFLITTSVSALTADMLGLDLEPPGDRNSDSRNQRDDADTPAPTSILSPAGPDDESPLRRIELFIEWEEGDRTLVLRRSTIVLDTSSLSGAFPGGGGTGDTDGDNPLGGDGDGGSDGGSTEAGGGDDAAIQRMIDALRNAGGSSQ